MRRKILWWSLGLVMVSAVGCNPVRPVTVTSDAPTATKTLELVPSAQITQENTVSIQLPSSNPLVVQASKDLARRLSVALAEIQLISAEPVVWPDGGLGCPRPGMVYPQVQQDGLRIILAVAGKQYRYHSGERRPPFLCE